ncbi:MAG: 50S ribosomal protein L19 [Bdellovibrionales bacterium]|nr:50S ribosomal protein L19 [Bdellovibrionales bacterium]
MDIVDSYVSKIQKKMDFPGRIGDTVNVSVRFQEAGKERIQVFSGVILKIQGKKSTRSFTVRKISDGVGVERTFPLASPSVEKVEVISQAKVRRARLFYLRNRKGRAARLKTIAASKK